MAAGRMYLEEKPEYVYIVESDMRTRAAGQVEYRVYATPGTAKGVRTQFINDEVHRKVRYDTPAQWKRDKEIARGIEEEYHKIFKVKLADWEQIV